MFKDFLVKFNQTFGEDLLKYYNKKDKDYYTNFKNVNSLCTTAIAEIFDTRKIKIYRDNPEKMELFYNAAQQFMELKMVYYYANDETGDLAYVGSSLLLRKILSFIEEISPS